MSVEDLAEINSVRVEGAEEGQRFRVFINGVPVLLSGKSFSYFVKLAWAIKYNSNDGWVYKEEFEPGFNQARYLYRMKKEITDKLGNGWQVIENNRLGDYRLDASPDAVSLDEETLKNHPDYSIRSLFEANKED